MIQKESISIQIKRVKLISKKIDMKINKKFKSNELIKYTLLLPESSILIREFIRFKERYDMK